MEQIFQAYNQLSADYPDLHRFSIGNSLENREITAFSVGKGPFSYLLVGSHHGSEWLTTCVCLGILRLLCTNIAENRQICGVSRETYENRVTLIVIPCLNPDGVNLARNGIAGASLLAERQLRINGGSGDFTHWQANARGVDLNAIITLCGHKGWKWRRKSA